MCCAWKPDKYEIKLYIYILTATSLLNFLFPNPDVGNFFTRKGPNNFPTYCCRLPAEVQHVTRQKRNVWISETSGKGRYGTWTSFDQLSKQFVQKAFCMSIQTQASYSYFPQTFPCPSDLKLSEKPLWEKRQVPPPQIRNLKLYFR